MGTGTAKRSARKRAGTGREKGGERLKRQGRIEKISLKGVAAVDLTGEKFFRFNPLGYGGDLQVPCFGDDSINNSLAAGFGHHVSDKEAVEFKCIEGEVAKVMETGIFYADLIQTQADPLFP